MNNEKLNIRSLVSEAQRAEKESNRKHHESFIPKESESFVRFFGFESDGCYYDDQLERVVFYSDNVFVVCYESKEPFDRWGVVYRCPVCEKMYTDGAGGWSHYKYLQIDPPAWMHSHDENETARDRLVNALRDVLGIE